MLIPMSDTDCAYAAGLIDGEGYIGINRKMAVVMSIKMTTKEPLEWLSMRAGGHIHLDTTRGIWSWTPGVVISTRFLRLILPYLKVKNKQAELALNFYERKPHKFKTASDKEWDWLDLQWRTMRLLNRPYKGREYTL